MARQSKINVDPQAKSRPLQVDAFAALDGLDRSLLKELPSLPVEKTEEIKRALVPQTEKSLPEKAPFQGRVILRRETKARGGKTVVVISGFRELPQFNAVAIGDLARKLRNKLGCGGSFDRQEILLQGDRPAEVAAALRAMGFKVDGVTL